MRSEYYKGLSKQEMYNILDGLSVLLHEITLKRLGVTSDQISTDDSNEILEICDEVIDQMHEELNERLDEIKERLSQSKSNKKGGKE